MFPLSNPTRAWFIVLAVAYFLLYGWFLWYSDFLPYVLDNNETFSSLVHAANLYHFGIEKTFGLTDEAYGMSAAAHPYVYTHQGNFPRLFAFLLYALGATSPESQIFLTTFTIGFLGICFAYSVFRRIVDEAFAVILCFLLMTDYVMFAQWQVNTWQVWHVFFFFSSLMCVFGLHQGRRALWIPVSILNFSCLIYYELLFALFVFTFCGVYASYLYRRNLKTLALTLGTLVGGSITGASVLVAQNIAYLGWEKFLIDLKLTYVGRNIAGSDEDLIARLKAFYEQNNIVFWHNIADAGYLRSPVEMLGHFVQFSLTPYTPFWVLFCIAITVAWLICLSHDSLHRNSYASSGPDTKHSPRDESGWRSLYGPLLLAAGTTSFASAALVDSLIIGQKGGVSTQLSWPYLAVVLGAIFTASNVDYAYVLRAHQNARFPVIAKAVVFTLFMAALVRLHGTWYDPLYSPLWRDVADNNGSVLVIQMIAILAVWLATRQILMTQGGHAQTAFPGALQGTILYLISGIAAYIVTALLLPGYLKTVYLDRYAPLTVFFHLVPFAILLHTVSNFAKDDLVNSTHTDARLTIPRGVGSVVLVAFTLVYWSSIQSLYLQRLPPNHFGFLKQLGSPPFQGASFVVNTYAAPVAVATGKWAYFDPAIGQGFGWFTAEGIEIGRNLDLLWFADKKTNPEYLRPAYFLCIKNRKFQSVVDGTYSAANAASDGCSNLPLVKRSQSNSASLFNNEIVATDNAGRDRWAIVRLDWDYPPYLRPLDQTGRTIIAKADYQKASGSRGARIAFLVRYLFVQKDGKPERRSLYSLYAARHTERQCVQAGGLKLFKRSEKIADLDLPPDFIGIAQIRIMPRSETKTGVEYQSEILRLGRAGLDCAAK